MITRKANRDPRIRPAVAADSIRARRAAASCRRSGEAGYTLLFAVFLAASMLIMLSVVSLKITTQGQREAEEEMIWRGHQYERGIQRYVQKFGRYPSKIDDLVKATSGVRYMREAYKDPMNKEDGSWRFIYVTPAGQLIGSVRYTSLVQMALMDKMASMGGSMNAMGAIPGTSPLNGNAASSFGNSSGFGSPGGFGSSNSGFGNSNSGFGSGSNGFGNQGSSGFGQQGNQGTNQNNRPAESEPVRQSGQFRRQLTRQREFGRQSHGKFERQFFRRPKFARRTKWIGRRRIVGLRHRRREWAAIRQRFRFFQRSERRQQSARPDERARRKHHRRGQQNRKAVADGLQAREEI